MNKDLEEMLAKTRNDMRVMEERLTKLEAEIKKRTFELAKLDFKIVRMEEYHQKQFKEIDERRMRGRNRDGFN